MALYLAKKKFFARLEVTIFDHILGQTRNLDFGLFFGRWNI